MHRSADAMNAVAPRTRDARTHGGLHDAELSALQLAPADVLDFSVSCNPYGPHPEVLRAIRDADATRYPDPHALPARRALGQALELDGARIALGNGACDLLWTLARQLVRPGERVVIAEPAFCEFRTAAERAGARIVCVRAEPDADFALDLPAALAVARASRARVLYLCTPSTPAGAALPARDLVTAAREHPALTFVVDQSFLALSERFSDAQVELPDGVIAVRSLTKEHAIPGVRVGYLLAAASQVRELDAHRPAWPVSAHAQAAVIATCRTGPFVAESRARLLEDRRRLAARLRELGLDPVPSTTCYLLARVGRAAELRARLLARHGILVRDCSSFGLPEHIRVGARPLADCERLLAALRQELES